MEGKHGVNKFCYARKRMDPVESRPEIGKLGKRGEVIRNERRHKRGEQWTYDDFGDDFGLAEGLEEEGEEASEEKDEDGLKDQ